MCIDRSSEECKRAWEKSNFIDGSDPGEESLKPGRPPGRPGYGLLNKCCLLDCPLHPWIRGRPFDPARTLFPRPRSWRKKDPGASNIGDPGRAAIRADMN